MRLLTLGFERFRGLVDADVELSPGTTLLLGDNGQGKTSLLEAAGVLATTKSFRGAKTAEVCRHGTASFSVHGTIESLGGTHQLAVVADRGKRQALVAGVERPLAEFIEWLTVIPVTQAHSGIIRGGPQERRDFLDRGVLGLRPGYLHALSAFRRTLRQKTALLQQSGSGRDIRPELAAWNVRLSRTGAEVVVRRREYVALLREALVGVGPLFLPPGEMLDLELRDAASPARSTGTGEPPGLDAQRVADELLARIEQRREPEISSRQALVGPQRDELVISHAPSAAPRLVPGDIRRFASSGQQRSALLALKMAKAEVFRSRRNESPVLLVDDVDTEVDPARLRTFLRHASRHCQTVLTSSKRDLVRDAVEDALTCHVSRGVITLG